MAKRVYLAGDIIFRPRVLELYDGMKVICEKYGFEGYAPMDEQLGLDDMPPSREKLIKIATFDRDLMDKCDGGLFCLDGFRGSTEMDAGTAVEIGYMYAQGKPLSGFTSDTRLYPKRVYDYFDGKLTPRKPGEFAAESGAEQDPHGYMVPPMDEPLHINAMVDGFIWMTDGIVSADDDFMKAFDGAAKQMAKQLGV